MKSKKVIQLELGSSARHKASGKKVKVIGARKRPGGFMYEVTNLSGEGSIDEVTDEDLEPY